MTLAVLFALTLLGVGYGSLRATGVPRGVSWLGLAPVVGLAVAAIAASWCALLGVPPPVGAIALYGFMLVGLGTAVADRKALAEAVRAFVSEQRLAVALLLVALAVPLIAIGFAFAGTVVPLSPHDGAAHTETIQAYRLGYAWPGWYPPGTAALFAAWLQAVPWIDSAEGAFDLGTSLPPLAALVVFGLGVALWRDARMAAAASLLLSFTYLYPYFPQLWSGWPLAISVILALGLWTAAREYLDRPSGRWGITAGLVLGAIVLVHGTELYTLLIVLPILLIGSLRTVIWRELPRVVGLAFVVALVCAAVYLPTLVGWAGRGGAYAVGVQDTTVLASSSNIATGPSLLATFALDSLGIDLPLRIILLAVGVGWSFRQRVGRSVVAIGVVFAGLAVALNAFARVPVLAQIYAITFPWGMHYRLLMLVTVAQLLLSGAGGVVLVRQVLRWAQPPTPWRRRLGRLTRLLVVSWVGVTTVALVVFMTPPASAVLGYGADDAAAMAWLHTHAAPGEVLVNDAFADAGIWAPYKAGVLILLQRSASLPPEELSRRMLIWANVGRLDQTPEVLAAACAERARYVYYGARPSGWDQRSFPPVAALRASPALEEVFSQGAATVFRTRFVCP